MFMFVLSMMKKNLMKKSSEKNQPAGDKTRRVRLCHLVLRINNKSLATWTKAGLEKGAGYMSVIQVYLVSRMNDSHFKQIQGGKGKSIDCKSTHLPDGWCVGFQFYTYSDKVT